MVALFTVLSTLYLLNPLAGVDFVPDFIPFFGNLDEAGAVVLLLSCLRYFGFDVTRLLNFARTHADALEPRRGEKVISPRDPEIEAARRTTFR